MHECSVHSLQYACKLCEAAVIWTAIDTFLYWAVLSLMAFHHFDNFQVEPSYSSSIVACHIMECCCIDNTSPEHTIIGFLQAEWILMLRQNQSP